jgi:hypothetical protein
MDFHPNDDITDEFLEIWTNDYRNKYTNDSTLKKAVLIRKKPHLKTSFLWKFNSSFDICLHIDKKIQFKCKFVF